MQGLSAWLLLSRWLTNRTHSHAYTMPTRYIQPKLESGISVELYPLHSRFFSVLSQDK